MERYTEHLISHLVDMSERCERQDQVMPDMRKTFEANRFETTSFLSGRFKQELETHQAELKRILTIEEIEFDWQIQDLPEQNAKLQRRFGEAVRFSGTGENVLAPGGSFAQGTACVAGASPAKLRTDSAELDENLLDPYPIPE